VEEKSEERWHKSQRYGMGGLPQNLSATQDSTPRTQKEEVAETDGGIRPLLQCP
jgi:hypothetical protein